MPPSRKNALVCQSSRKICCPSSPKKNVLYVRISKKKSLSKEIHSSVSSPKKIPLLFFVWILPLFIQQPTPYILHEIFQNSLLIFFSYALGCASFNRDLSTFYMQPGFLFEAMISLPLMRTLPETRFLFPTFQISISM